MAGVARRTLDELHADACARIERFEPSAAWGAVQDRAAGGEIFRTGLWGTRVTRPTAWETCPEIENGNEQASDHAAVFVDLNV